MSRYAQVCVEVEPYHLDRPFDYAVPDDPEEPVRIGSRVLVVFGGRRVRGLVTGLSDETDVEPSKVRALARVLGPHAWMAADEIEVARWAADRFAAPLADVIRHALPGRTVDVERRAADAGWFPPGAADRPADPPGGDADEGWRRYGDDGTALLEAARGGDGSFYWRPLPGEDLGARLGELTLATLSAGRDVLVVVPDRESQAAAGVVDAVGDLAVDLRGQPSPRTQYRAWLSARCGVTRAVVGERGVVFWPLERLGLAICVDESNPALKERRSPRHHAREVVLERARRAGAVGLLVGHVPSAEAWRLLSAGRLQPLTGPRRVERDLAPLVRVATAQGRVRTRLLPESTAALRRATADGEYGVVLTSRRGEGRLLACTACGTRLVCPDCGAGLDPAAGRGVVCPRCDYRKPGTPRCPECGGRRFAPLAAGAARLTQELARTLDVEVAKLEGYAADAPEPPAVLVMTRGSVLDAPPGPVGAVVLPDVDALAARPGLDAAEDTLRLTMQIATWTVAGRDTAGRGDRARDKEREAIVVVQTREPAHPVIQALVRWDPGGFWRHEAAERAELRLPPAGHAVRLLLPAQASDEVARDLREALPESDRLLGPLVEGRDATVLIKSADRSASLAALDEVRRHHSAGGTEFRVEVDPVDVA